MSCFAPDPFSRRRGMRPGIAGAIMGRPPSCGLERETGRNGQARSLRQAGLLVGNRLACSGCFVVDIYQPEDELAGYRRGDHGSPAKL